MKLEISPIKQHPMPHFKARIIIGSPQNQKVAIDDNSESFLKYLSSSLVAFRQKRLEKLKSKFKLTIQIKLPS